MHCAPAGHTPSSVSVPMISRSRYCWDTAAIEITGIAHRSDGRVGDGFALFPPAFPRSSALSGQKPALQFFPLEWECTNLQQFSLQEDLYCFVPSGSRVAEATDIMVILGSFYEFFSSDRVYLSGYLTAFNFEELIMHFIWLWKCVYIYIYCRERHIIYGIQEPLGILLKWEHNVYLSSSEEVEVVSWGCWAEQLQSCSSSSFRNVTSRTPQRSWSQSGAPGPKTDLRIIIFKKKRKRKLSSARMSWCQCPRALEGRPLWGRAVYTGSHGARLSSVPSGDRSANPASVPGRSSLKRALLSVSSAQKCSGAGRLATPSGVFRAARSAVFWSPDRDGIGPLVVRAQTWTL